MEYYMNRCRLNNVCVSRGLKAQQFHSPGHRPGFVCERWARLAKAKVYDSPILLRLQVGSSKFDAIFCTILDSKCVLIHRQSEYLHSEIYN